MPAARKRLTQRKAQEVFDGAQLVKAPDWAESSRWHVVGEDGTVLVVVSPSYGGVGRSGRNGWRQHPAALGPSGGGERHPTRQSAAVQGLAAWMRWATAPTP
ncbi:hypothetical protein [Streptomyces sp. V1I6]|uniref:hypothetical protein n=1 Tax=Streptomyces sp. V1I6 TaxID=3042273 RepID=UPI002784BE3C|nr:hypothetical protein [Streptomyces sp. V1I6]MDQ0840513.1 hypothetical protein [Streptomyces sp. V1I6]